MELKNLLLRMIHSDYKLRPSAKEVLEIPIIRDQVNDQSVFQNPLVSHSDLSYIVTICIQSTAT